MGGLGAVLRAGISVALAACAHAQGAGRPPQSQVHRTESAADDRREPPPPSAAGVALKLSARVAVEPGERAVPKCGGSDDVLQKR